MGIIDTPDTCWDYFIEKVSWHHVVLCLKQLHFLPCLFSSLFDYVLQVQKYLHVVLCFSPVGDKFRVRAREFPALVNCTIIDWFHSWPHEALVSGENRRHHTDCCSSF